MPLAGQAPDGYRNFSRGGGDGGQAESTGSRLLDGGQPTLPTDFQKAPSSPTPGQIKKNNNYLFGCAGSFVAVQVFLESPRAGAPL